MGLGIGPGVGIGFGVNVSIKEGRVFALCGFVGRGRSGRGPGLPDRVGPEGDHRHADTLYNPTGLQR